MDPFIPLVGKATIHYFADDEDCAFINIPYIHSGRDKYGPQDIRLRRLLELTMHYTFLIAHVAMEVLQKYAENDDPPSRKDLCREILREAKDLRQQPQHKSFFDSLDEAR